MTATLTAVQGDITRERVDAIVNAANEALLPGGGVCGAIHRAAGPGLWEECRGIGRCDPGEAVLTGGYRLPAPHVIHTVGPIWEGGRFDEDATLASCYRASIALAQQHGLRSLAFPAISTGIYGFPAARAAPIAVAATREALASAPAVAEVRFVCFEAAILDLYRQALGEVRPAAGG
ncbi:MAG TPA: O-acetyl-ADP-ribose deacetylase [Dehalococcoidia bacterium]|nr:O-acetyl-ADP-ribose deacetylase [Dehalococcoidia bacterium]